MQVTHCNCRGKQLSILLPVRWEPREWCEEVPKEWCEPAVREECWDEPRTSCNNLTMSVCRDIDTEQCVPSVRSIYKHIVGPGSAKSRVSLQFEL